MKTATMTHIGRGERDDDRESKGGDNLDGKVGARSMGNGPGMQKPKKCIANHILLSSRLGKMCRLR